MKYLVILACIWAVAYGRAQRKNVVLESTRNINSNPTEVSADSEVNSELEDVAVTSERRGKYKAFPDQYNEESSPVGVNSRSCKEKNERYAIPGSCDRYIECLNGTAEEKLCPDGLRYNPNVNFKVYPCQYPIDVPCLERSAGLQPAQPTEACPHQFGYFKIGDPKNCSAFRNCVNGVGFDFTCPDGLAFSSLTYRCEWPDESQDCDAEAFLGFRCPVVPESKELGPPAGFRFYRSASDCQMYFVCINGKPRRLSCGGYSGFDEATTSCVSADQISECPSELRARASLVKKEEEERNAAEGAFAKLRYAQRQAFAEDVSAVSEPLENVVI